MTDCHIHMLLDGRDWKNAIARHAKAVDQVWIRRQLAAYQAAGVTYVRDGGDRWGVGAAARAMAPEYGIVYRTPLAPLYRRGHYGSFIGVGFDTLREFAALVREQKQAGADFIKIMISGLMDFSCYGRLTQPGLDRETVTEMIHIAHGEGMAVMAHANGAETVLWAAQAGVDSVEHGAYLNREAMQAMEATGTVWVPTLSTVGNLLGKGRFPDDQVEKILASALENLQQFGGLVAPGTDAGAWAVPHACQTETALLARGEITEERLAQGIQTIRDKF